MYLRITQPGGVPELTLDLVWPADVPPAADAPGRVRDVTVRRTRSGQQQVEWLFELTAGWTDNLALRLEAGWVDPPARMTPVVTRSGPPFRAAVLPIDRWTIVVHGKTLSDGRLFGLLGEPAQSWHNDVQTAGYLAATLPGAPGAWAWNIAHRLEQVNATPLRLHRMRRDTQALETWDAAAGAYRDDPAAADPDGAHHVLFFDWDEPSNYLAPYADVDDGYAYAAGDALVALLVRHALLQRVMTFVAHSRGAVVASEAARRMVRRGVTGFQCLYLDGEGWRKGMPVLGVDGYADAEFHGWAGTRADQVRQACDALGVGSLSGIGAAVTHTGGQPLAEGNDVALRRWPQGTFIAGVPSGGGRLDHTAFPEFFADWAYVTTDPSGLLAAQGGVCLETPVIANAPLVYPELAAGAPPGDAGGLFNGDLAEGSLAGWVYHGGTPLAWSRAWNLLAAGPNGQPALPLTDAQPAARHNWTALPGQVDHLTFEVAWQVPAAVELVVQWEDLELGRVALSGSHPSWTHMRLPVDLPADAVGRLVFRLDRSDASTGGCVVRVTSVGLGTAVNP